MANGSGRSSSGPRRLGNQSAQSAGARRRAARARTRRSRSSKMGWIAVGVVVVAVAALVIVKVTSGSGSPTADASGRNPALAPAGMVNPVTHVPQHVFDQIGVNGQPAAFTVTKNQKPLSHAGKPRFVYVGGEFCPYCAAMRWSMVAALARFGTFTNLKETSSAPTDGNMPTFSFLGATYSSPYVAFTPYEESDRQQNPLMPVPADVQKLYATYDGNGSSASIFSPGGAGIPFLDIGNKYVSAGDPPYLSSMFGNGTGPLVNGGPGSIAVAQAVQHPTSSVGTAIGASGFIVMANYIAAAICDVNGGKPGSVCATRGVKAAASVLAKAKPVG